MRAAGSLRPEHAEAGEGVLAASLSSDRGSRTWSRCRRWRAGGRIGFSRAGGARRQGAGADPAGGRLAGQGDEGRREDVHQVVRAQNDHGRRLEDGDDRGRSGKPRGARMASSRAPSTAIDVWPEKKKSLLVP